MSTSTAIAPTKQTAGRVLVDSLRQHGVDRVFCVPGESYLEVLDALHDASDDIELIVAKHEGGAANMAEADGKMTGRPGICMVTRGPGATHASIGVHIAQQDSTPMILFVGQIARKQVGRDAFQEVDFYAMFGKLAKWVVEVTDASRMAEIVARAFHTAVSGRPGPVVVSLPEDMLVDVTDKLAFRTSAIEPKVPSDSAIAKIREKLANAQRPLVVVGGSGWCQEASAQLAIFAKAWNLPVACSFRRQDVLDNRNPQYVGHMSLGMSPALKDAVVKADVILALGTRLGDVATGGYTLLEVPVPQQDLVHVHVDATEIGRVYRPSVGVNADILATISALANVAAPAEIAWAGWTKRARAAHEAFSLPPTRVSEAIGVDLGVVMQHAAEVLRYRDREVLCVAGDGCFLMYPQELATAAAHNVRLITIVVNNGMYGTIRMHQENRYPGRISGTQLAGPNYVALANSLGAAHAEQVRTAEEFPAAFARARAAKGFALIELVTDPKQVTPVMRLK